MGLTHTLATSLAGLNATQTSLGLVAGNVANAQTPGYVTQRALQSEIVAGDAGVGVRVTAINRMLDAFVQQQLRTESAGGGYADMRANFLQQLQAIYGQPGSGSTLDAAFNNFTGAVQALTTAPGSAAAQNQTIAAAQSFAQALNNATTTIQTLRQQADQGIAADVQQANNAMQQIAAINGQLAAIPGDSSTAASLEDQRDQYIDQLSKLMDIRVVNGSGNQITVFTTAGQQLVGLAASQLTFNPTGTINANMLWNADPAKSRLGSIMLVSPSGTPVDLTAQGGIRSGEIAAYLSMRDGALVEAQSQLDQIAAQMSGALSDTTTAGSAVSVGAQNGYQIDLGNMLNGNTIHITYTDGASVAHTITVVRVDDPAALPLPDTATSDPNDSVIGIDFSGGP